MHVLPNLNGQFRNADKIKTNRNCHHFHSMPGTVIHNV
jgi:hypothetical protein